MNTALFGWLQYYSMLTVFEWSNLNPCRRGLTGNAEAITGEKQQWCKMMQNGSMFSQAACCQATCIHTTSKHLPVCVNEATKMTWVKRNNSNPLCILRYNKDILFKKIKTNGREGNCPGGLRPKEKNNQKLSQSERSGCCRVPSILRASAPDPWVCQGTTCHLLEKIIQMQKIRRRNNPFAKSVSCAPSVLY